MSLETKEKGVGRDFMSKKKSLNKHKGPLKMAFKNFNDKRFEVEESPKQLRGGDFAYIALDSCAVINMAKVECHSIDTAFSNKKEKSLKQNLEELLRHSAIKNGFVCNRGKYVLCIVPAVLEEVDMSGKQFSQTIQRLLIESFLKLEIKPEFRAKFDEITEKIMHDFKNHDLFVNGFGNFMEHDARITAQAAIFNLAIASQDKHLIEQSNGHRDHIKFWSARHLIGDHNGHQAVPMALCEIMNLIRNNIRLPELENVFFLTDETRKQLERMNYSFDEYARPNPLYHLVQNENFSNKSSQFAKFESAKIPSNFVYARQHD